MRYRHLAVDIPTFTLIQIFIRGLQFDLAVTGYILAPAAVIGLLPKIGWNDSRITRKISIIYITIIGGIAFFMTILDLEFFAKFNARLNHLAIEWMDTPDMVLYVVWTTHPVIPYILGWIAFLVGFWYVLTLLARRVFKENPYHRCDVIMNQKTEHCCQSSAVDSMPKPCTNQTVNRRGLTAVFELFQRNKPESVLRQLVIYPLVIGLLFLCIRGRVGTWPLSLEMASFSPYYLANQLVLNSGFSFARGVIDTRKRNLNRRLSTLMPVKQALEETYDLLDIDTLSLINDHPLARYEYDGIERPMNVVMVMIESGASEFVKSCGGSEDLMPEFERIAEQGLLFTRFYSNGFHTHHGMIASICGVLSMPGANIMKLNTGQQTFSGLAILLKERGYQTRYYATANLHFGGKKGFMYANSFDELIGLKNYPKEQVLTAWGAPDEILYDRSITEMNRLEEPFFALILTISTHEPFLYPEREYPFPETDSSHPWAKRFNSLRYADWAFGRFMDSVKTTDWYKNTLFVILGDHGLNYEPKLELDLSQFHVPLLLFYPDVIDTGVNRCISSQKDIPATVMHLLGGQWINNTLGHNLLDTGYVNHALFYSEEGALGFIFEDFYLLLGSAGDVNLYELSSLAPVVDRPDLVEFMSNKSKALLSTSNYLITSRLVGLPK